MKKLVTILTLCFVLCTALFGLTACTNETPHTHVYNQRNTSETYLKSDATLKVATFQDTVLQTTFITMTQNAKLTERKRQLATEMAVLKWTQEQKLTPNQTTITAIGLVTTIAHTPKLAQTIVLIKSQNAVVVELLLKRKEQFVLSVNKNTVYCQKSKQPKGWCLN